MSTKDYMDTLYAELKAERERALQAALTLVRVREWLLRGQENKWELAVYPKAALEEVKAHFAYVEALKAAKKEEVSHE